MTASTMPRETMVPVGALELFVRERGEGQPLLMLNGLGGNVEMWGAAEDELASVVRTITCDSPGTGRSPMPFWPLSIPALADLVVGALDRLGYGRVDVLGFSLGGLVAQEIAHRERDRVRRMGLVATACGWGSMPGTAAAITLAAMPIRYHSRLLYERTKVMLNPVDAELVDRLPALKEARLRYPPSLLGYTWQLWAGALWSSLPWLPSVEVPTLLVHGEADELVPPANGVQLARLLPDSRLHVLSGEGHLLVYDPNGGALPLLRDFFSSPSLDESAAWSTATVVDDDETVEAAFTTSVGGEPIRSLSGAYRRYVGHVTGNGRTAS
jgi:pimeloyl-ACP methyl ester carboxylesterase